MARIWPNSCYFPLAKGGPCMSNRHRSESGTAIRITLLGRFSVRSADAPDPIRVATRVQHLLAYLLLNPHREFRRDHLAETLWGTRRHAATRKHLRQALWGLRSGISTLAPGYDLLSTQGWWVRASPDGRVHVDAIEFEEATRSAMPVPLADDRLLALIEASRLYEGDLLDGWGQEWCTAPREHLRRRFLGAMDALMGHFEGIGDSDGVLTAAARALEIDPARESAHRGMIRLLLRSGDRGGAIRQYRACEAAVLHELGVAPEEATRALYDEILKGGRR